jgi:hypothetical protein
MDLSEFVPAKHVSENEVFLSEFDCIRTEPKAGCLFAHSSLARSAHSFKHQSHSFEREQKSSHTHTPYSRHRHNTRAHNSASKAQWLEFASAFPLHVVELQAGYKPNSKSSRAEKTPPCIQPANEHLAVLLVAELSDFIRSDTYATRIHPDCLASRACPLTHPCACLSLLFCFQWRATGPVVTGSLEQYEHLVERYSFG